MVGSIVGCLVGLHDGEDVGDCVGLLVGSAVVGDRDGGFVDVDEGIPSTGGMNIAGLDGLDSSKMIKGHAEQLYDVTCSQCMIMCIFQ